MTSVESLDKTGEGLVLDTGGVRSKLSLSLIPFLQLKEPYENPECCSGISSRC